MDRWTDKQTFVETAYFMNNTEKLGEQFQNLGIPMDDDMMSMMADDGRCQ